ncbi:hypothetical protein TRFO_43178 [Tritrichomonas foetus]|uniref:Uncharacterized protein n=1 Tax=Tritrichomonas foetus TaxID=1144522 RepID=A0A1J4KSG2_9EUKA|nr:hypothetical protein TRFO_43178 [Tritrichomonas foetus]|eukprot:OHT14042.1 hypothetical protein TRFO_43178 [Tritrichomonas foetus]
MKTRDSTRDLLIKKTDLQKINTNERMKNMRVNSKVKQLTDQVIQYQKKKNPKFSTDLTVGDVKSILQKLFDLFHISPQIWRFTENLYCFSYMIFMTSLTLYFNILQVITSFPAFPTLYTFINQNPINSEELLTNCKLIPSVIYRYIESQQIEENTTIYAVLSQLYI